MPENKSADCTSPEDLTYDLNRHISKLHRWHERNKRDLPFRKNRDAYRIWISEIMLQQTRVNAMIDRYNAFMQKFPGIRELAKAEESDLNELWKGLGYYARARNILKSAKILESRYGCIFPDTYEEALALPGIGDYTASAVISMAYGKNHAVFDGNVKRVLSRALYPVSEDKILKACADSLIAGKKDPGRHNESLMELGAVLCRPGLPECRLCPIQKSCSVFQKHGAEFASEVPEKKKVKFKETRAEYFMIFTHDRSRFLSLRSRSSYFHKNLWQIPARITVGKKRYESGMLLDLEKNLIPETAEYRRFDKSFSHSITNHKISADIHFRILNENYFIKADALWLKTADEEARFISVKNSDRWIVSSVKDKVFRFLAQKGEWDGFQ